MQLHEGLNKRWDLVGIGIIVNACLGTVYSWSVFRAPLQEVLGITAAQSGLPYSVFLGAFAFSMPLGGALISRVGPRITLLAGGALVGLGWMIAGFAGSLPALVLSYGIIGGVGVGLAYGVPLAVAGSWFPDRRGLAMGLTLGGFGVSPFVTAPLAEFLIIRLGVQSAMTILGVGFVVIIPVLVPVFRRAAEHDLAGSPGSDSTLTDAAQGAAAAGPELPPAVMLRQRSFYGLWLCFFIGTLAGLTAIGMTASFGQDVAGMSAPAAAAAVSAFAVFNGLGRPLFGAVHDRLGTRGSVVLSFFLIAVAAVISLFAADGVMLPFFLGFGIFWLMLGGWLAIAPAATTRLFGAKNYARNYGIMYTAYGVGALIGGGVFSALYGRFGSYSPMFVFVLALCGVALVLALVLLRPAEGRATATAGSAG